MNSFRKILSRFTSPARLTKTARPAIKLLVEALEDRRLMHASVLGSMPLASFESSAANVSSQSLADRITTELPNTTAASLEVPIYNSNPGASRSVYLDFNDHSETFKISTTEILGIETSSESMTAT